MSHFTGLELAPIDPIFGLNAEFNEDKRKGKINLTIGVYKDASIITPVMRAVTAAEREMIEENVGKVYLPIHGNMNYLECVGKVAFGERLWGLHGSRIAKIQSLGGTGALRLGGELLALTGKERVAIPNPTWANHKKIFFDARFSVEQYPYYDSKNHTIDFDRLMSYLDSCEEESVILLHAVCQNPTGVDPTNEEWKEISDKIKKKRLIPFFDCAYQGFGDGLEKDREALELFLEEGHEFFLAYSFSKNMGMYGERLGALFVVSENSELSAKVTSQLKQIVRGIYSNPPLHGAKVAEKILSSESLSKMWRDELEEMRLRIIEMRKVLVKGLKDCGGGTDFDHVLAQKGMFSLMGISKESVAKLKKEHAIYMTGSARLNFAGLNQNYADIVSEAIIKSRLIENA